MLPSSVQPGSEEVLCKVSGWHVQGMWILQDAIQKQKQFPAGPVFVQPLLQKENSERTKKTEKGQRQRTVQNKFHQQQRLDCALQVNDDAGKQD